MFLGALYVIAMVVFLAVMWRRIGKWEDAQDELERRREARRHDRRN